MNISSFTCVRVTSAVRVFWLLAMCLLEWHAHIPPTVFFMSDFRVLSYLLLACQLCPVALRNSLLGLCNQSSQSCFCMAWASMPCQSGIQSGLAKQCYPAWQHSAAV
jgi:hypothetical protein